MKNKICLLCILLSFSLSACGSANGADTDSSNSETDSSSLESEEDSGSASGYMTTDDIYGTWRKDSDDESGYFEAVVDEDTVTVSYLINNAEYVMWLGTYVAPSETKYAYTWQSENLYEPESGDYLYCDDDETRWTFLAEGSLRMDYSRDGTSYSLTLEKYD